MGRYGLTGRIEPSHAGFNPLKYPWEALGSVNCKLHIEGYST